MSTPSMSSAAGFPARVAAALLVAGLCLTGPARASADESPDERDDLAEDTVTGRRPPALQVDVSESEQPPQEVPSTRPYSDRVYRGARQLKTSEAFVSDGIEAMELLYRRNYKACRERFAAMGVKYPGWAIEPVGQVLLWQAMMLENFDYKYVSQYETAWKRARVELENAIYQPGNEAWEYFILGGILGIDAIHTMRTGEYLTAVNRGVEAMKSVNKAKEYAPDFKDTMLGDGLFNYWRTVIAMSSRAIPDMGDQRAKGIEQMLTVEREAIFLGPPATLAMVFTWMEEGDMNRALASCMKNKAVYPENIVNNLVLGRVYMYMKRHTDSERAYLAVIAQDPKNERVHYYLTRLYLRTGDIAKARTHIATYLAFNLDDESRGYGLYQKGLIDYHEKDWAAAELSFEQSWRLARLDRAKKRLDLVKEKQSAGG